MSASYGKKEHQVFDILSAKQFEIGNDPELAALHIEATRHFCAAIEYREKDCYDFNLDYELDQVGDILDSFDEVKEYDKGL